MGLWQSQSAVGPAPVRTHLTLPAFAHPATLHTSYKLKKQKEETEKQLEKTQTIQKTKIFALGTFKKKIRFSVCPADASWCLAEVWIFLHLLVQLVPPLLNPFHLELVDRLQVFCVKHKAVEFPCSFVLSVALFYDRHATLIDRENERNGEAGSVC